MIENREGAQTSDNNSNGVNVDDELNNGYEVNVDDEPALNRRMTHYNDPPDLGIDNSYEVIVDDESEVNGEGGAASDNNEIDLTEALNRPAPISEDRSLSPFIALEVGGNHLG